MSRIAGRGATANGVSRRFGLPERAADGDWRDWEAAYEEPPPLKTTVILERPRTALSRNDSPDIPFDRSFNAYRGCEHGCIYCFARPTHAYHDLSPGLDFETKLFAKPGGPALLRAEFAKRSYKPAVLAMGTNTDPYQPIERRFRITRRILELCAETSHPVAITTKSDRVLDDLPLLADLAAKQLALVMLSVTSLQPALARAMEPRAAAPHRRLLAMRRLADAGVPVILSASPMIPALNDMEVEALVEAAAAHGARDVVWIPVRLPHEVAPLFRDWLEAHFPDRAEKVLNGVRAMRGGQLNDPGFGSRMRAGGEWGQLMRARFARVKRKMGFPLTISQLRTDIFQKSATDARQGSLFSDV